MVWALAAGREGPAWAAGGFDVEISDGVSTLGTRAERAAMIFRLPW